MTELKPCPWCGGTDLDIATGVSGWRYVGCKGECLGKAGDLREDAWQALPRRDDTQESDAQALLRELLWSQHPCMGKYGDDGEQQCGNCGIDFKRMSASDIRDALDRRGVRYIVSETDAQAVRAALEELVDAWRKGDDIVGAIAAAEAALKREA